MKKIRIKKVLVIYKEELKPHLSIPSRLNPTVLSRNSHLTEHEKTLLEVREVLKQNKIDHRIVSRGDLKKVKGFDLLITVGGDGTFLDTSHYASPRQVLLGVNSHPQQSHGALCHAHRRNFKKIFADLLKGKVRLLSLNRLRVRIEGKRLPILALNDVLFANRSPAGTSRYLFKMDGKKEEQKSSGIWISTAAGSTGAIRSAGGKAIHKASRDLQFVVREPFIHSNPRYKILRGRISPEKTIRIISRMTKAAVFLDGAHLQYDIEFGEEVEIRGAKEPIWAVLK